jgi:Domain of unknown function (DUF4268)
VGKTKKDLADRYAIRKRWRTTLIERSAKITKLHAHITPGAYSWIGVSSGIRGLNLNYVALQDVTAAELYVDRGKDSEEENERIFDQLLTNREAIEKSFGGPLSWERLEDRRACRVRFMREGGGYRAPEQEWPTIQDAIITAMNRLEQALRPFLKQLKISA